MQGLLAISRGIDRLNGAFGALACWLVLIACLISAGNATIRYIFSQSSNAWLEIQWYFFSGIFLFGASYTLKVNEHVRVDLIYAGVSERTRLWIDLFGFIVFMMPVVIILTWMTWPFFLESWTRGESSSNAGGLVRWPVKLILPIGFLLLTLQALSEAIKRVGALRGLITVETKYEKPLQ